MSDEFINYVTVKKIGGSAKRVILLECRLCLQVQAELTPSITYTALPFSDVVNNAFGNHDAYFHQQTSQLIDQRGAFID